METVRSGASHTLLEVRSRASHNLEQLDSRSARVPSDRPRWSPQAEKFEQGNGAEANVSELGRRLREFKLTSTIKFGDEQDFTFPSKALSDVGRYSRSKFYTAWDSEEDDTNNFEEYTTRSDTGPYGIRDFDAAHIGRQYAGGTNSKKRKTTTGFTSGSPGTDEEPPDGDEDSDPDEPPFRRGGGGKRPAQKTPSTQDKAVSKLYACPYFKKDPGSHHRCRSWQTAELHRVKFHVLRTHLKHIQCPRCGYRAGELNELWKHQKNTDCSKSKLKPLEEDIVQKANKLEKCKGLSWKQIYVHLFECPSEDAPDPFVELTPSQHPESRSSKTCIESTETLSDDASYRRVPDFGIYVADRLVPELQNLIRQHLPTLLAEYRALSEGSSASRYINSPSDNKRITTNTNTPPSSDPSPTIPIPTRNSIPNDQPDLSPWSGQPFLWSSSPVAGYEFSASAAYDHAQYHANGSQIFAGLAVTAGNSLDFDGGDSISRGFADRGF